MRNRDYYFLIYLSFGIGGAVSKFTGSWFMVWWMVLGLIMVIIPLIKSKFSSQSEGSG